MPGPLTATYYAQSASAALIISEASQISPLSTFNDIDDSNPEPLFTHVVQELARRDIGFLHVIEGMTGGPRSPGPAKLQPDCG